VTKLDWDRERRDRAAREKGSTRAQVQIGRAVPASDKLVDRLVRLGYTGPRPATAALARELIRKAQEGDGQETSATDAEYLSGVARAIDRLIGQPTHTWADELPRLFSDLTDAYKREDAKIKASRALTTTKWDRELVLTRERMRLERRLRKMQSKTLA